AAVGAAAVGAPDDGGAVRAAPDDVVTVPRAAPDDVVARVRAAPDDVVAIAAHRAPDDVVAGVPERLHRAPHDVVGPGVRRWLDHAVRQSVVAPDDRPAPDRLNRH